MPNDERRLMTSEQVAAALGVHVATLRYWVREGRLPVIKMTRKTWRFDRRDVNGFLQRNRLEPTAA